MNPISYQLSEHGIQKEQIDKDALFVISRLKQAGFDAYAVGGCVRDLLLGRTPKDFDITTNAKPEEIKRLFRSCLLIGKRFRLAHIRFHHNHIIEVATFRSGSTDTDDLIVRDNTWGTEEEDALRRDFTINGLFYDIDNETIIDYVGGFRDIQKKILRTIGDPYIRFKQDPVRMIRLLKFQARFGMQVEGRTQEALHESISEIEKSAPARVLEEIFRMLESGYSHDFFTFMTQSGLLGHILPHLSNFLKGRSKQRIYRYLLASDQLIISKQQTFKREVLFASLIYPRIEWELEKYFTKHDEPCKPAHIQQALHYFFDPLVENFRHFPRRMKTTIAYVIQYQFKLTPLTPQKLKKPRFLSHQDFGLVLDFLRIRSEIKPKLKPQLDYWKERYQKSRPSKKEHEAEPRRTKRHSRWNKHSHHHTKNRRWMNPHNPIES